VRAVILKVSLPFEMYSELMTAQAERYRIRSPEKIKDLLIPYSLLSMKLKIN